MTEFSDLDVAHIYEDRSIYDGWSVLLLKNGQFVNRWKPDDRRYKKAEEFKKFLIKQQEAENIKKRIKMTEFDDFRCENICVTVEGQVIHLPNCKLKDIEAAIVFAINNIKGIKLYD
jgi:hypothetical protein